MSRRPKSQSSARIRISRPAQRVTSELPRHDRTSLPSGDVHRIRWGSRRDRDKRLNSPNDLVVIGSHGLVHRSELRHQRDLLGRQGGKRSRKPHVYYFDARDGSLCIVANDFRCPNGIAFSCDGKLLYIADSGF
jgi:sugar lactone lactonase YvrE